MEREVVPVVRALWGPGNVRRVDVDEEKGLALYLRMERELGFRSDVPAPTLLDPAGRVALCGLEAIPRAYGPGEAAAE